MANKEHLLELRKRLSDSCPQCKGRIDSSCECQKQYRFFITLAYAGIPQTHWTISPKSYLNKSLLDFCNQALQEELPKQTLILLAKEGSEKLEKSSIAALKFFIAHQWSVYFVEYGDLRSLHLKPRVMAEEIEEGVKGEFENIKERRVLAIHDLPLGFGEKPIIRMEWIKLLKYRRNQGCFTLLTCQGSKRQFLREFDYLPSSVGEDGIRWIEER